ncbi:MAG: hypothetical protein E5X69_14370, partial [Mesorhizobium sp.]
MFAGAIKPRNGRTAFQEMLEGVVCGQRGKRFGQYDFGSSPTWKGRRDSAPLWSAGHLPHLGGDWQLRRRRFPFNAGDWRKRSRQPISLLVG